jgi:histone acetyltransferase MCC1
MEIVDLENGGGAPPLVAFERGMAGSSSHSSCASSPETSEGDCHIPNISFRSIQLSDRHQIQALHEEWFPVSYQTEFYDELVHSRMANSGNPLYTCIAVQKQSASAEGDEGIAACVVGSFVDAGRLSAEMQNMLISDPERYSRLFYIMTLGTVDRYRNVGLGTAMVRKCMEQVEEDPSCGVLYLHVIVTNQAAIRFYEKLGFDRVHEIPNYYSIDDKLYSCYLYAKYYHGNRGHRYIYRLLYSALSSVWNRLKVPLALLIDFSSYTSHDRQTRVTYPQMLNTE